ncbi:t-SNARE [Mycena amicta]|nr:t-SNARE [Mycena amicta]
MSFQDLESGLLHPARTQPSLNPQSRQDAAFLELQSSLSLQVFKMNANVQAILRLVDQLGTAKDAAGLRKSLHDISDTTRSMAKRGSEDLKKLKTLQTSLPHQKTALQKTSHDLEMSVVAFQRAQQLSAERQRTVVAGVRMAVDDPPQQEQDTPAERQALLFQEQLSPHELAYQESLIQEREREIREIESGITEIAEIFADIGTLVHQQGTILDNVESNISSVAVDVQSGADELSSASEYQRRAGRRAACLMLVLVFVTAIVLLAILS